MAKFCSSCGGQASDDATVCPVCGNAFGAAPNPQQPQAQPTQNMQQQPQAQMDPNNGAPMAQPNPGQYANPNVNAKPDTLMCILCYLGILALVPFLSKKEDAFIQFHAKQGLNLFIVCFIASLAVSFIQGLTGLSILGLVSSAISIFEIVLMIMGIIAATKGEMKVLPLMDQIKIIK